MSPRQSPLVWLLAAAFLLISITGPSWRADAPHVRARERERERRGY